MQKYWYVYKRYGNAPSYKHFSEQSAVDEAVRLLNLYGGEYEILEAKSFVKAAPTYIVEKFYETPQETPRKTWDSLKDPIPF